MLNDIDNHVINPGKIVHSILIVEDDVNISNMLIDLLGENGYDTKCAYSGTEALLNIKQNYFDLILLDLMLPGLPGEKVVEKIRQKYSMPILAVSAKGDQKTKIDLLKMGADDYITKPFDTNELLARIEVQLRRYSKSSCNNQEQLITYKDICLNLDTFKVYIQGIPLSVTKREFLILELLMRNHRKVFTKNNIYKSVWKDEFFGDDNTVNVHICNIRTKLSRVNPNQEYIQTVWGIGFKMCD
jgi:DNA-binding response OmpR family regulator